MVEVGRQLGLRLAEMEARLKRLEAGGRSAQLGHSSIDDGHLEVRDDTQQSRARFGRHTDGTIALTYANGPKPPTPTAATLIAAELSLVVVWDGMFAGGVARPADVVRVDIHESETPDFTPDGTTIRSSLPAEGARLLVLDNQPHHVKLVAVTTSDVASDPSTEVVKTPLPVSDLAAGAIDGQTINGVRITGSTIIGNQILTAAEPPHVFLNPNPPFPEIRFVPDPQEVDTNLVANPSFETDLAGWQPQRGTLTRVETSVVDTIPAPSTNLRGIEWDGANLWVTDVASLQIHKLNPTDGSIITSFSAPSTAPYGLAWDGANFWHSDFDDDLIYKLDPADGGSVLDSFAAPAGSPIGLAWDGTNLWLADDVAETIYKLDPSDGSVIATLQPPDVIPEGLTWDGATLWVSDEFHGTLAQIDPADGTVLQATASPATLPEGLTWDGTHLRHLDSSGTLIYRIDPADILITRDGSWACRYDSDPAQVGARYVVATNAAAIPIAPGQTYTAKATVHAGSGFTDGQVNITWRDSAGVFLSPATTGVPVNLVAGWQEVTVSGVAPDVAVDVLVWVQATPDPGSSLAHFYTDNIQLGVSGGYHFAAISAGNNLLVGSVRDELDNGSELVISPDGPQIGLTDANRIFRGTTWYPSDGRAELYTADAANTYQAFVRCTQAGDIETFGRLVGGTMLIAEFTFSTAASSVVFSNLPQGYDHLKIMVRGNRINDGAAFRSLSLRFNGDAGNNYGFSYTRQIVGGGDFNGFVDPITQLEIGAFGTLDSNSDITVFGYSRVGITTAQGSSWANSGTAGTDKAYVVGGGRWDDTTPVTSVEVFLNTGEFAVGNTVQVYGVGGTI